MKPIVVKMPDGWECRLCRFEPESLPDALTHASTVHGAVAMWDENGDIWDGKEPSLLREMGVL